MTKKIGLLALILSSCLCVQAQVAGNIYYEDLNTKVFVNSIERNSAWAGGMNNPQFGIADLNEDHIPDLVIYEQYVGVKTFINTGTASNPVYKYDNAYEHNFPYMYDYMKLLDYNGDGIVDLFHKGQSGYSAYRGYYNNLNQLCFKYNKDVYYYDPHSGPSGGWINAYAQPGAIPGMADVDGDGDLDLVSYDVWGSTVQYYRNCAIEDGLSLDSLRICLKDMCWGKTIQYNTRKQVLATTCTEYAVTCPKTTKKTDGANNICLLDYDGDGDMDYLNGNNAYSDIQLVINGRIQTSHTVDSMISQDTSWSSNGHKMIMPLFPAAYWLDVDDDGDHDLLFSPYAKGYENYKCATYYKNVGSDKIATGAPNYVFQTDTFLVDQMIDLGSGSYPAFYDYNKDGKPDLFVGSDGYYQSNGTLRSRISFYQNNATSTTINSRKYTSFNLINSNFMNLDTLVLAGAAPAFGDLDNDGKDDMVLGLTDGTVLFFKNNAASNAVQPDWKYVGRLQYIDAFNNYKNVDVGTYAAPCIYDIDTDGKADLLIGCAAGTIYYFQNLGVASSGAPGLKSVTSQLGGIKITQLGVINPFATPFIGKIDDSGIPYLLIGSANDSIYQYTGFQNGNTTTNYTLVKSSYQSLFAGPRTAPAVADVDGDGFYEMVVGNDLGGLKFYKQYYSTDIGNVVFNDDNIKIYPNPANDKFNISWVGNFDANIQIDVVSVTGQKITSKTISGNQNSAEISLGDVNTGVYYCVFHAGDYRNVKPVTIIR